MIKPLGKYLLVKIVDETKREEQTESGIVITEAKEDRVDLVVSKAKVVNVSNEIKKIEKDDIVYFNYFSGNVVVEKGKNPLGTDDEEMILVHEEDLLAKEV